MNQTMQSAMDSITMKRKLDVQKEAEEKGKKEASFWEKELLRMATDPENKQMKIARTVGLARTSAFLASVTNPKDKEHETNLGVFKTAYGMDSKKLESDFIKQAEEELGAREFERRDPSTYESNVLAKFRPTGKKLIDKNDPNKGYHSEVGISQMDMTMYNNFCSAVQAKWEKSGYRFDSKIIPEIADRYGMEPNNQAINFRELQLKP
jgi:hypothetical protein